MTLSEKRDRICQLTKCVRDLRKKYRYSERKEIQDAIGNRVLDILEA